jgi:hypothetical protein
MNDMGEIVRIEKASASIVSANSGSGSDSGSHALAPRYRDPEVHAIVQALTEKIDARIAQIDAEFGILPQAEIPCSRCEIAWAFTVLFPPEKKPRRRKKKTK